MRKLKAMRGTAGADSLPHRIQPLNLAIHGMIKTSVTRWPGRRTLAEPTSAAQTSRGRNSRGRTSATRISARTSAWRASAGRFSGVRSLPKRSSPKRSSPGRSSAARTSARRQVSLKNKLLCKQCGTGFHPSEVYSPVGPQPLDHRRRRIPNPYYGLPSQTAFRA